MPCTTLRRKIRTGVTKNKHLGPQAVLGEENERKIVAHIKKVLKSGFAPTRTMVRIMAHQLAEQLGNISEEHDLFNKPGHLYNMDETDLQLNNRPEHVIAEKGSKNVAAVTSGEKGDTVTVISCCNAEGAFTLPRCILKGKNMKKEYEDCMVAVGICSSQASRSSGSYFGWPCLPLFFRRSFRICRNERSHTSLPSQPYHTIFAAPRSYIF